MSSGRSRVIAHWPGASTCGYCGSPGSRSETRSSYKVGSLTAVELSCEVYQEMIDRGWRRAGTYCYKPDLKRSCCPQYTIKLDALEFKPSRSHRKLAHRWNRFIFEGDASEKMETEDSPKPRGKGKNNAEFSLIKSIHESESSFTSDHKAAHKFEVVLEPSSYTDEKYALYETYQEEVHNDSDNDPSRFKRFLVDSPLKLEPISYPSDPPTYLPKYYGSYHQLYRVDGELVAMGVIDVLPSCVSSVYFMYDKKWEKYSFGKMSAMREAALARELHEAGIAEIKSLYMGFYIHSCQKMRYKGEYSPSYLLDPEEYTWHPFDKCVRLLEEKKYTSFAHPEYSRPVGYALSTFQTADWREMRIIPGGLKSNIVPLIESDYWSSDDIQLMLLCNIDALGLHLSKEVLWQWEQNVEDDEDDSTE